MTPSPLGSAPKVAARREVQGTVREVHGGPVASATVVLEDGSPANVSVETGPSGEFTLTGSAVCTWKESLWVLRPGYWQRRLSYILCDTPSSSGPLVLDVPMLKTVGLAGPGQLDVPLSNDDLDWGDPQFARYFGQEYACGPCTIVSLPNPSKTAWDVTVSWPTADPLRIWIEASDRNYDTALRGEYAPPAGASTVTFTIPQTTDYFYFSLKVGLPWGSRASGGLGGPSTVRVAIAESGS